MITSQQFDFRGARGHLLSGRIERPQAPPRGRAIFAHCFTCGNDSLAAFHIQRARTKVVHTKRADETPADLFTRTIELHGPLNADERQKLLAIADRCPVDLTLVRGADVQTVLAE